MPPARPDPAAEPPADRQRGEIAVRIIRACRDEGIETVAVYADSDRDAIFVRMADQAHALAATGPRTPIWTARKSSPLRGPPAPTPSIPAMAFCPNAPISRRRCRMRADLGRPRPGGDPALGDKIEARRIAEGRRRAAGRRHPRPGRNPPRRWPLPATHGLPIAIKAAFGGGGRGMKVAWRLDEVEELFLSATREALTAFGRGECFIEQFWTAPPYRGAGAG